MLRSHNFQVSDSSSNLLKTENALGNCSGIIKFILVLAKQISPWASGISFFMVFHGDFKEIVYFYQFFEKYFTNFHSNDQKTAPSLAEFSLNKWPHVQLMYYQFLNRAISFKKIFNKDIFYMQNLYIL